LTTGTDEELVLTVLLLAGCDVSTMQPGEEAALEAVPILFASPTVARVRPGDTLATVARRHGVSTDDLLAWNGLASDRLEADQILFVWPPVEVAPRPAPRSRTTSHAVAAAPAPTTTVVSTPTVAPIAPPPHVAQKIQVGRSSVRGAGVLGTELPDGSDLDLRSSAAALETFRPIGGNAGLGSRGSLAGGGDAETLVMAVPEARFEGPAIPDAPITPPSVPKPAPKACLSGAAEEIGEEGITVSRGLDAGQISAGMSGISRYTPRCFPRGTEGTYTVLTEVVVGCDGRVAEVVTLDPGAVPDRIVSCIETTLASAAFPAHALPDGVTFQIPLKFSF